MRRRFSMERHKRNHGCVITLMVSVIIVWFAVNAEAIGIHLSSHPSIQDREAARQLGLYIYKMTGESSEITTAAPKNGDPAIFVGINAIEGNGGIEIGKLKSEEWYVRSIPEGLLLMGEGPTGTLYAVYHYLEDVCGVRWWTPWDEYVPKVKTLKLNNLNLHGVPSFKIREIYATYGHDGGCFDSHMRLNSDEYQPISSRYGGFRAFGPPYFCHTFKFYIPPKQYFKSHPEWFSMIGGKRIGPPVISQLCLTNQELRKKLLERLLQFIAEGEANAKKSHTKPPFIYDISQNDNKRYCQCPKCKAFADREGQSGLMIDCINELANAIKADHPDIYLNTFAYEYTEKPPKTIKPVSNVIITLCDTLSNAAEPITSERNSQFYKKLKKWSQIAPNLRVWDYATTFVTAAQGLPFPSADTYANDLKLFKEHNVKYIFCQLGNPIIADARDYKIWMLAKYMENVNLPFDELAKKFTDGYYGRAGILFRKYRQCLRNSQNAKHAFIGMNPSVRAFTFLNCATLQSCQKIFEQGKSVLRGDETLLARWRFAFLSMHRAICIRRKSLMVEWYRKHKSMKNFPFDIKKTIDCIRQTWTEEANRRLQGSMLKDSLARMEKELTKYATPISIKSIIPPDKFANVPIDSVFYYTADDTLRWLNIVTIVKDENALSGKACCLTFPNKGGANHCLKKYHFPLAWGIYSPSDQSYPYRGIITAKDVPGPGYHWYKLGCSSITSDSYMYFFWSWLIKLNINDAFDARNPKAKFDIWARMKFTGPAFPKGEAGESNAIFLDCVVLVKKQSVN